jgi:hypothetical protein
MAVLTGCVESGARSVLLDEDALPAEFFDLSTLLAGELLHKLTTYRIRLAGVVPDPSVHSTRFQQFVREANAGRQFRFFSTRQEAIGWLEARD